MKSERCGESDAGAPRYGAGRYDDFPQLVDPHARAEAPWRSCQAGSCVRPGSDTRKECLNHDPNLSDREPFGREPVGVRRRTLSLGVRSRPPTTKSRVSGTLGICAEAVLHHWTVR